MASNTVSLATRVKLSNGVTMPQIQLGLYMMSGKEVTLAVKNALAVGYRAFDSAQMYGNERECGKAIKDFLASNENIEGLQREDIHYTSKLSSNSSSVDQVRKSITRSVQACGLGYIDLFLLHSPYGGSEARLASWRALEGAVKDGEVKSGGISNFGVRHIEELMASKPEIKPVINQIEVHPFNTRTDIRETTLKHGMLVEAYAPLARALRMKHPTIVSLSKKYQCTPGQLHVRWSVQHGLIPLPKTARKERLAENGNVGFFDITSEDMDKLDALDEYLVTDWDPVDCP